jgi:spore protease
LERKRNAMEREKITDREAAPGQDVRHSYDQHKARTDLACEAGRTVTESHSREEMVGGRPVTICRSREESGGRYVTVSCGAITERDGEDLTPLAAVLAGELQALSTLMLGRAPGPDTKVLVAGLGNAHITPDAVGPGTVSRMTVTRHLRTSHGELYRALGCCELSALAPGVLGQTGIEAAALVREAAVTVGADLVVAVDALAARSCERLASTVQLSDRGVAPGSGIGNHRLGLDRETVGCPVLAVGVPTVVDSATLVWDALEKAGMEADDVDPTLRRVLETGRQFIVSPRDCDRVVRLTCVLLARSLDMAFGVER